MRPRNLLTPFLVAAALAACAPRDEAPTTAPATDAPAAASQPAAPPPDTSLTPEQAAALVRPHSPVIGPALAPVTLVEFLDPACEACRAFAPVVKQVSFLYPKEVRVVVRFAAFHEGSDEAIRLLAAARRQGKFETVLTALFDGQEQWASHHRPDLDKAWQLAAAAGLDMTRARRDAAGADATELLRIEAEDIIALKVTRTPTFYVNGKLLTEFGAEPLLRLVKSEVEAAARPAN